MAATQRPVSELAFTEPSGPPAWKSLPSWTVLASPDKAAGTDVVGSMAERAGATITEVECSHVIPAIRACLAGQRVLFRTATEWVAVLADAQRHGRLDDELGRQLPPQRPRPRPHPSHSHRLTTRDEHRSGSPYGLASAPPVANPQGVNSRPAPPGQYSTGLDRRQSDARSGISTGSGQRESARRPRGATESRRARLFAVINRSQTARSGLRYRARPGPSSGRPRSTAAVSCGRCSEQFALHLIYGNC
jgi:hypothetical protein